MVYRSSSSEKHISISAGIVNRYCYNLLIGGYNTSVANCCKNHNCRSSAKKSNLVFSSLFLAKVMGGSDHEGQSFMPLNRFQQDFNVCFPGSACLFSRLNTCFRKPFQFQHGIVAVHSTVYWMHVRCEF